MKTTHFLLPVLVVLCIDLSYAQTESVALREWRTAKVSRTISLDGGEESSTEVVERLKVAFAEQPIDEGYTELQLDRISRNPETGNFVFAFHVRYVEDIWAVFVVDEEGQVQDNFVLSSWGMYED